MHTYILSHCRIGSRDFQRLASGADSDENGGVELVQDAHRTSDDLVYAPDTECDEFWLSWPGVQERAIADGTVLVFDVFSSVGNLFIALEHAMKVRSLKNTCQVTAKKRCLSDIIINVFCTK